MGHKCLYNIFPFPRKWKLAHSMMCPQAVDREGSIQTWRGTANKLNMQSPTGNNSCE